MAITFDELLRRLTNVKRSGDGYTSHCPSHDDQQNSLSINLGDDDRILMNCFVGCQIEAICKALGITVGSLFLSSSKKTESRAITIGTLAANKKLPAGFLGELGLEDRADGVVIPYWNIDRSLASRHRLRTALSAKDGSIWLFGKGKPVPYGLDRLADARKAGYLILVEGESDCWTLWHTGFPALGIPGATMTSKLRSEHLEDISKIYVIREPGDGGQTFADGVARRLAKLKWKGEAFVVPMTDAKDPNELYKTDPEGFGTNFQQALDAAEPLKPPKVAVTSVTTSNDDVTAVLAAAGILSLTSSSTPAEIESALRKLLSSIPGADRLKRTVVKQATEAHLSGAGIRSTRDLVAAAFSAKGADATEGLFLEDPEPSEEEVDPSEMADRLIATLTRHISLPEHGQMAIALWVLHCYVFDAIHISPILCIRSPLKRCGKTTLLELIGALVPKALLASNITPAAVFRSIEKYRPTLLVDEADTFLTTHDELRGVINASHYRTTAKVIRCVGEDNEPKIFSTWCPKVISLIGRLPGTLEDRSILISMRRRSPGERLERLRRDRIQDQLRPLREQMARWAKDNIEQFRELDPECPEALDDRAQDNWRPLLAVAQILGPRWCEVATEAALSLSESASETDNTAMIQLLEDLRTLFQRHQEDFLPSELVVNELISLEDRPWPEWKKGQPLTKVQLSRLLSRFTVTPTQQRHHDKKQRGYRLSDLQDCFARYLPPESGQRDIVNDFSSLDEIPSRDTVGTVPSRVGTPAQHESNCPDSESGRPDLVPTRLPFESGRQQPRGGTDDRDEYDL